MSTDLENDLVKSSQRGDRQAMEALVNTYEKPVYNAAYRMLGNRDDAADVTQTTFLKAFRNLGQYKPEFPFFSWIYRIALNESVNVFNRRPRSEVLSGDEASSEPGPDALADADQMSRALQRVLLELSDDHRSAIVLKYFVGCSYQEMAGILAVPEKTVRSRLFSARRRMKECLERDGVTLT